MTSSENNLALCIIKEYFGETARTVASLLIVKKFYPLPLIAADLSLDKKRVAQALATLAIHNLVEYKLNAKQFIDYRLLTRNVLNFLKYPLYIKQAEEVFGDKSSSMIVHEILVNGYVEMSSVVLRVVTRLVTNELDESEQRDAKKIESIYTRVREGFVKLVGNEYVERLPALDSSSVASTSFNEDMDTDSKKTAPTPASKTTKRRLEKMPKFAHTNEDRFTPVSIRIDESRILKAIEESTDAAVSVCVRKPNEDFGDNDVYWRVNEQRFMQDFRDKALIDAIEHRIDSKAASILKVILKWTDSKILADKALPQSTQSKTITLIDIQKEMRHEMETNLIDKYLSVILLDSFKVVEKIGDFGGGAYAIDFKKATHNLCLTHVESYVREKHGSKSLRIFRVILDKSQLEQRQIEDMSMIPSKDCKVLLYDMVNDGLLIITELSKTNDHAPSRTFYLYTINVYQVCKKLLENAFKGMKNLMIKRDFLNGENKRLLEKNKKIDTLIESLRAQGAEQAEIDDVRAMMSSDEVKMLSSINGDCKKIELAETQLSEVIFLFECYFYYHTIAPVITTGRSKT